jgi:hypothetical protein
MRHGVIRRTGSLHGQTFFSEFPFVSSSAERGEAQFSHLSAVSVVAVIECLEAMQLHRTALMNS